MNHITQPNHYWVRTGQTNVDRQVFSNQNPTTLPNQIGYFKTQRINTLVINKIETNFPFQVFY